MFDSYGDGWNGATYTVADISGAPILATGDLDNAAIGDGTNTGTDTFCLPDGCYTLTVGGGGWDGEISWNLLGADGGTISGTAPQTIQFDINGNCVVPTDVYNNPGGTISTCIGTFYDSGGILGNHGNYEVITTTICPDNADDCIQLDFSFLNLESCCDQLTIYDGDDASGDLVGVFTGTNSPGTITASDGCLTFVFSSDFSVTNSGWAAAISCVTCPEPPPPPDPVDFEVGCPDIDLGADIAIPSCTDPCTGLDVTASYFETGETTSYQVNSIDFNPPYAFDAGAQFSINQDDYWSDVITLPFDFCFFGNIYNQCLVGPNGLMSFDVTNANAYCDWQFNATCPSNFLHMNAIFGVYHDIDPADCGVARYAVLGTAPCRVFVVNYDDLCHYGIACDAYRSTTQIVLYETTNAIEVYVQDKPTCTDWNSGNAVIGVQNATGTVGFTPPGRNTGPWSASNEAWRFTPNGASIVDIDWYSQADGYIGSGETITVCPDEASQAFVAEATYSLCDGSTVVVSDDIVVTCAQVLLPVEWLSFEAKKVTDANHVLTEWVTASEHNNDFFTVERSKDGLFWEAVGMVSGSGNTLETNSYQWLDRQPFLGVSYYRVKQTDFNGEFSYSGKRAVEIEAAELAVYPNPGNGKFILEGADVSGLTIYDSRGRKVLFDLHGENTITLRGAAAGAYVFEIRSTPNAIAEHIRVVVN